MINLHESMRRAPGSAVRYASVARQTTAECAYVSVLAFGLNIFCSINTMCLHLNIYYQNIHAKLRPL